MIIIIAFILWLVTIIIALVMSFREIKRVHKIIKEANDLIDDIKKSLEEEER